jgi:hypothetical protein
MAIPITVSIPAWMRDYIKETGIKPSKLLQKAIIAKKEELDYWKYEQYRIMTYP